MNRTQLMRDFEEYTMLDTSHNLNLMDGDLLFASTDGNYNQPLIEFAFWCWVKSRDLTLLEMQIMTIGKSIKLNPSDAPKE